jgi:hypothetical protein
MSRVLGIVCIAVACTVAACTHDETVDRRSCEKLRDHLIEVRVSSDGNAGADTAQHRDAMKTALGDDFLDNCERTMSVEQLHCAMNARDLGATSDCSRTATASN